jgi:alkyl hydroperoxide reductase subunit AhpF
MRVSLSPHSMPDVDQAIRVNSVIDPMVPDKRAYY